MKLGRLAAVVTPLALMLAQPAIAGATEDRWAIVNLVMRYGELHDFGSPQDYAAQFTADAEMVVAGRVVARGHDAIAAQAKHDHERFGVTLPDGTQSSLMRHLISNAVVESLDGDHATASSYVTTIIRDGDEGPKILSVGRYLDSVERVGGRWRIARRTIVLDFGNAELGRKYGFGK